MTSNIGAPSRASNAQYTLNKPTETKHKVESNIQRKYSIIFDEDNDISSTTSSHLQLIFDRNQNHSKPPGSHSLPPTKSPTLLPISTNSILIPAHARINPPSGQTSSTTQSTSQPKQGTISSKPGRKRSFSTPIAKTQNVQDQRMQKEHTLPHHKKARIKIEVTAPVQFDPSEDTVELISDDSKDNIESTDTSQNSAGIAYSQEQVLRVPIPIEESNPEKTYNLAVLVAQIIESILNEQTDINVLKTLNDRLKSKPFLESRIRKCGGPGGSGNLAKLYQTIRSLSVELSREKEKFSQKHPVHIYIFKDNKYQFSKIKEPGFLAKPINLIKHGPNHYDVMLVLDNEIEL